MPLAADVNLEELAAQTGLYSGADLGNLCKEVIRFKSAAEELAVSKKI